MTAIGSPLRIACVASGSERSRVAMAELEHRYRPVAPAELARNPADLLLTELASFTDATTDENYWIYRLSMAAKTSQKK